MISRQYLPLFCALVCFCNCNPSVSSQQDEPIRDKPNIIYILADDLGYGDLSSYGQTHFQTPNIDRIANQGIRFTAHYSGATVCAPSRSALMTGLHTGHTPVRGNKEIQPEGQWPMPDSAYTLAEMLQSAGYITGAFGKWGLGFPGSEGDPNNQGFDEFFGYNCQRLAHHYYPYYLWDNQDKVPLEANAGHAAGTYAPIAIHERALDFIDRNRDTSFFLFYPTPIPHAELLAPEAYMEQFRDQFLPEKNYEGIDEGDRYRQGPYGSQEECHAAFAAMIKLLDDQVGEILDQLQTLGLAENTLIIFTSDNGPHQEGGADPDYFDSNGPYRGYKRDLYEGGIRVPMLAKWPGKIPSGSSSDHPSAFWDVMPTLADILDIDMQGHLDGISFLPALTQTGNQPTHDYLYWEFHERGGRQALRKGDWKLVRYNVNADPPGAPELYNLNDDPGETTNLADQHPARVDTLMNLLEEARNESPVFRFASEGYNAER